MSESAVTVGVEEEYQLIDPIELVLQPEAEKLLDKARPVLGDNIDPEVFLPQIEIHTDICSTLAGLRADLQGRRRVVIDAAESLGIKIAAAGTHPFSPWRDQATFPKRRYKNLLQDHGRSYAEQVVFGCHVHIGIADPESLIQTMNRVRPWVAILTALSANSPFWLGHDTDYASYRSELWNRWPMAGMPPVFASRRDYEEHVSLLVQAGALREPTKLYWAVRPSHRFPTLEFRAADVCLRVDEAVMIAGLARALTRTCYEDALADAAYAVPPQDLLKSAQWRAARFGLEGQLLDATKGSAVPAADLVQRFLIWVRPALESQGDWDEISELVRITMAHGNGATRQRVVQQQAAVEKGRDESMREVVRFIVAESAQGLMETPS